MGIVDAKRKPMRADLPEGRVARLDSPAATALTVGCRDVVCPADNTETVAGSTLGASASSVSKSHENSRITGQVGAASSPSSNGTKVARKLRRSCDLCALRKRKCDSQLPCSFCLSRNHECHYTERQPAGSRTPYYTKRRLAINLAAMNGTYAGHAASRASCGFEGSATVELKLKRARFSASLATGLVGSRENAFLSVYFHCMGFLPLLDASDVRQGIVGTMTSPSYMSSMFNVTSDDVTDGSVNPVYCPTGPGAEAEAGPRGTVIDASKCSLWCAVGIGALVQGQPLENVRPYVQLARRCLSDCFEDETAEVARGYTAMAYLYNFLRQDDKAYQYLQRAKSVTNRLPPGAAPEGIEEILSRGMATRVYHDPQAEPQEILNFINEELPSVKAFLIDATNQNRKQSVNNGGTTSVGEDDECGTTVEGVGLEEVGDESGAGVERGEDVGVADEERGVGDEADGGHNVRYTSALSSTDMKQLEKEGVTTLELGVLSKRFMKELMDDFVSMQNGASSPEVSGGVGGLLFNGLLGYMQSFHNKPREVYERVKDCAEIIVRYPGVCRLSNWLHLAHCILAILYGYGSLELFEKVRKAFNDVCVENMALIPPFREELDMACFCDHIFCRFIGREANRICSNDGVGVVSVQDAESCAADTTTTTATSSCSKTKPDESRTGCETATSTASTDQSADPSIMEETWGTSSPSPTPSPPLSAAFSNSIGTWCASSTSSYSAWCNGSAASSSPPPYSSSPHRTTYLEPTEHRLHVQLVVTHEEHRQTEEGKVQGPADHRARGCCYGPFEEIPDLGTAAIDRNPVQILPSAFRTMEEDAGRQTGAQWGSYVFGHRPKAEAEGCGGESGGGLVYGRSAANANVSINRDVAVARGLGEEYSGGISGASGGSTAVRLVTCPHSSSGVSGSVEAQGYGGGGPAWVQTAVGNLDRLAVDDREEKDDGEKTGAWNAIADQLMEYIVNEDAGLQRDVSSCGPIPSFREFNGDSDTSWQSLLTTNGLTG